MNRKRGWIKIKKGGKMPKQGTIVDIWADGRRMTNYILTLNYAGIKGNNFFYPEESGIACVRYDGSEAYTQATYWRYLPQKPKN